MKHKILSFLTAFAMVFGIIAAPFVNAKADEAGTVVAGTSKEQQETTVTLHKLKLSSLDTLPKLDKSGEFIEGLRGEPKEKYVGGEINNIKDFFSDDNAEELAGVKFTYWVFNDEAKYKEMIKDSSKFDTVEKVDAHLKGAKNLTKKDIVSAKGGVELDKITIPANENRFIWAVETSKVIPGEGKDGKDQTITGMKAVPFGLALPLFNKDGSVNNAIHVYPKNTTAEEPKVDKDFKGKADANKDRKEIENNIVEGAFVGKEVPYEIETLVPAGSDYQTAKWTDQMTEGLTFNENSLKVYIGSKEAEKTATEENYLKKDTDYTLVKDGNGFKLEFTTAGLGKINKQTAETRVHITYSATVNDKAKVQRQERNDVIFHYGNKQEHSNTPKPQKPKEGKLKVTKSFPNVEGEWVKGEEVKVTIYDAHTGKPVEFTDGQSATQTLTIDKKFHEWTGLDTDRQYIVKETFKPGNEAEYGLGDDGEVTIKNYKNDIPKPKDPEEPGVVSYGHRFQKVDQEGKGLVNAEFIISKTEGNKTLYLVKKGNTALEADQKEYVAAEKAYKDAVKNNKSDKEIAPLKTARDKAYAKAQSEWEFSDKKDNATVFKSSTDGYFRVSGIEEGEYQLEEKKAPEGYAKLTKPVPFTVGKDSFGTTKLEGTKLTDDKGFTQVENKKVTIPQTGGIGSIIFVVAGLMIMGLAAYKMKANKEQA